VKRAIYLDRTVLAHFAWPITPCQSAFHQGQQHFGRIGSFEVSRGRVAQADGLQLDGSR